MCINMWFHITKSICLIDTPSNIYTFNNRHEKKTHHTVDEKPMHYKRFSVNNERQFDEPPDFVSMSHLLFSEADQKTLTTFMVPPFRTTLTVTDTGEPVPSGSSTLSPLTSNSGSTSKNQVQKQGIPPNPKRGMKCKSSERIQF